ncbi:hypothetical protein NDU88_001550 [Pleurodeles waltl]|uniref:Uncharacterized protein n=1 Tax=Pleurodeles waltl TaxID=8319 RepID=A0AAV7P737_PLEWA|nr:hypothetical protein NDU88_001550 [Pleurodeles waltl]
MTCKPLKGDLSSELRKVRRDLDEVGEIVAALKDKDAGHSKEIEWLQEKALRLNEQQIDLQSHTKDFKNRSRQNNIRIKAVATNAEGSDMEVYADALFRFILGDTAPTEIKHDQFHRVGPLKQTRGSQADIFGCVHDFQATLGQQRTRRLHRPSETLQPDSETMV